MCIGKSNNAALVISLSFHFFMVSPFQQTIASSYTERFLFGITRFSSMPIILLYPSHTGHAPKGLLKLKRYSFGSSNKIPSSSNLFEKLSLIILLSSRTTTWQYPLPVWKAVWAESAALLKLSAECSITSLSITMFISWPGLYFLRVSGSSILTSSPSTSILLNPCFSRKEKYSVTLIFSGISADDVIITFFPSGRQAKKSTISSALCFLTSFPETGEKVRPILAKKSLR